MLIESLFISTCDFQNTEKSKDWYKTMFKQIHKIPGRFTPLFQRSMLVVLSPCACCVCYVTLCCLSITVLRGRWGKPLSPLLHFPWELWHSGETKRYQLAATPLSLSSLTRTFHRYLSSAVKPSHKSTYLITLKVFEMFSLKLLSGLFCISASLF